VPSRPILFTVEERFYTDKFRAREDSIKEELVGYLLYSLYSYRFFKTRDEILEYILFDFRGWNQENWKRIPKGILRILRDFLSFYSIPLPSQGDRQVSLAERFSRLQELDSIPFQEGEIRIREEDLPEFIRISVR